MSVPAVWCRLGNSCVTFPGMNPFLNPSGFRPNAFYDITQNLPLSGLLGGLRRLVEQNCHYWRPNMGLYILHLGSGS